MTYILRAKTIANQEVYFRDSYGGRIDVVWTHSLLLAKSAWSDRSRGLRETRYIYNDLSSAYRTQRVEKESFPEEEN